MPSSKSEKEMPNLHKKINPKEITPLSGEKEHSITNFKNFVEGEETTQPKIVEVSFEELCRIRSQWIKDGCNSEGDLELDTKPWVRSLFESTCDCFF